MLRNFTEWHENLIPFYFIFPCIMTELENYFHICFKVFHSSQSLVVVAHNTQIALSTTQIFFTISFS